MAFKRQLALLVVARERAGTATRTEVLTALRGAGLDAATAERNSSGRSACLTGAPRGGEVAGRTVEARRILLRQLSADSAASDNIFQRLQQAEVEDLEHWADNPLDARNLAEVLG